MKDKLAIGCGENFHGDEWVHLDQAELEHVDIVQNLEDNPELGFEDDRFGKVVARNVLEHLSYSAYISIIEEIGRVSESGAEVVISGPHFLCWNSAASDHFRSFSKISMNVFCTDHEYPTPMPQPFSHVKDVSFSWNEAWFVDLLRKVFPEFLVSKHIPNTVEEVIFKLEVK